MNIIVTTIDHHRAKLDERELFACSEAQTNEVYRRIKGDPAIDGGVLVNTCNRTELYLSLKEGMTPDPEMTAASGPEMTAAPGPEMTAATSDTDPFRILCEVCGIAEGSHRHLQQTLRNEEALRHLCLLAAGAESQLWGDSQIITQIGDAIEDARNRNASDAVLNTVFRLGITAGKEIRTNVDFFIHDESTAARAVEEVLADPEIERVLVIGNGTIGRMVARRLAETGRKTMMTLRKYRHGETIVPEGVEPVPYAERYEIMAGCDGVISATASPHLVITRRGMLDAGATPRLMIDMAVPRDIEAGVEEIPGVSCRNIDDISSGHHVELRDRQRKELDDYVEEKVVEYHRWERSREKVEERVRRLTDPERDPSQRQYFPLFINSMDRRVLVIGGGNIAERRVMTLAEFGFRITVLSESLTETLERMAEGGAVTWERRNYVAAAQSEAADSAGPENAAGVAAAQGEAAVCDPLLDESWLVLACTNDRSINRQVGKVCREKGIMVNVCDARNESTVWFPAVALSDELTVGLVGKGTDHMNVKKAASALRRVVERKEYKK